LSLLALDHPLEVPEEPGFAALPPSPDAYAGADQAEQSLRTQKLGILRPKL
jgi:hypothetical protein